MVKITAENYPLEAGKRMRQNAIDDPAWEQSMKGVFLKPWNQPADRQPFREWHQYFRQHIRKSSWLLDQVVAHSQDKILVPTRHPTDFDPSFFAHDGYVIIEYVGGYRYEVTFAHPAQPV